MSFPPFIPVVLLPWKCDNSGTNLDILFIKQTTSILKPELLHVHEKIEVTFVWLHIVPELRIISIHIKKYVSWKD